MKEISINLVDKPNPFAVSDGTNKLESAQIIRNAQEYVSRMLHPSRLGQPPEITIHHMPFWRKDTPEERAYKRWRNPSTSGWYAEILEEELEKEKPDMDISEYGSDSTGLTPGHTGGGNIESGYFMKTRKRGFFKARPEVEVIGSVGGEYAGMASIKVEDGKGFLQHIEIQDGFRGQGVSDEILRRAAEEAFIKQGAESISSVTRTSGLVDLLTRVYPNTEFTYNGRPVSAAEAVKQAKRGQPIKFNTPNPYLPDSEDEGTQAEASGHSQRGSRVHEIPNLNSRQKEHLDAYRKLANANWEDLTDEQKRKHNKYRDEGWSEAWLE